MRVSKFNDSAANMAAAGMYGFKYFDVVTETRFVPPEGMRIAAIQTFEEVTVNKINQISGAVADIPENGFPIPEGYTVMLNADEISVASGSGLIYYGGVA